MQRISKKVLKVIGLTQKEYTAGRLNKFSRKISLAERQRILNAMQLIPETKRHPSRISKVLLAEMNMTRKELNEIRKNILNFTPFQKNNDEVLIDIIIEEEDSMIAKQIKKFYDISKVTFGERVMEINFKLKTDESQCITVIIRRSDDNYAYPIYNKHFIDSCYEETFKEIAKTFKPDYWDIKLSEDDLKDGVYEN